MCLVIIESPNERNDICSYRTPLIICRKKWQFGTHVDDFTFNTLQTIELANISQCFTAL